MAGTGSLRSEPRDARLARFLAAASGAEKVEVTALTRLRGGALQENWALDARFSGSALDGDQRLVLRSSAATGIAASLTRLQEFALQQAAFATGVTVEIGAKPCDLPDRAGLGAGQKGEIGARWADRVDTGELAAEPLGERGERRIERRIAGDPVRCCDPIDPPHDEKRLT